MQIAGACQGAVPGVMQTSRSGQGKRSRDSSSKSAIARGLEMLRSRPMNDSPRGVHLLLQSAATSGFEQLSLYAIGSGEGSGSAAKGGLHALTSVKWKSADTPFDTLGPHHPTPEDSELLSEIAEEAADARSGDTHVSRRRALCRQMLAGAATAMAVGVGSLDLVIRDGEDGSDGTRGTSPLPGDQANASPWIPGEFAATTVPSVQNTAVAAADAMKKERRWLESRVSHATSALGVVVPTSVGASVGPQDSKRPLELPETYRDLLSNVLQAEWDRSTVLPAGLGPRQVTAIAPASAQLAFDAEDMAEGQARQSLSELHAADTSATRIEKSVW